jgi:RNA polymerase sigma-70 factor (ECF subfamily)
MEARPEHAVMTNDDELLQRAVLGDEGAFRDLYLRHRDPVFRFCYRLLGTAPMAEDVTHDCFLSLLQRAAAFDARRASLRTYLCAAARNLAFKQLRRRGVDVDLEDVTPAALTETAAGPLQVLLCREREGQVAEAVSRLPPLQREALVLFEYEEMSLAEIAEIADADTGTISARLHRAREGLRRMLGPPAGPLPGTKSRRP